MKTLDWRDTINRFGLKIIKKRKSPLLLKGLSWELVAFAAKCGESNPLSFSIRPLVMHKKWRTTVGIYLGLAAIVTSIIGPEHLSASQFGDENQMSVLPEPAIRMTTTERVTFPLPVKEISQGYWLLHKGTDFRVPEGTPINPIMAGKVVETEFGKYGYGFKVLIEHEGGYKSLYAHLSTIDVVVDQKVTTDDVIGKSGNTGRSTGPHLHLEVWENEQNINPEILLGQR